MESTSQPLVSVPVITYNSSKYVIETLESIKAQTYQNIELIVSDDCSKDNTVEICRKWIEENKDRFVRTEIITSDINTGVSANGNRGREACRGEWIKSIAGDDLLMPNCITDCVDYINNVENVVYLFGRHRVFGLTVDECEKINNNLDFTFYNLSISEQLHKLYERNCICAPACFYNRRKIEELNIYNDTRIPMLEDWPKWINVLKNNIKLHFINKDIVKYRIGSGLSTSKRKSLNYYRACRLMHYYYLYPAWYAENPTIAIERSVDEDLQVYKTLLDIENKGSEGVCIERDELLSENQYLKKQLYIRTNSKAYKLGKFLLYPLNKIKSLLSL